MLVLFKCSEPLCSLRGFGSYIVKIVIVECWAECVGARCNSNKSITAWSITLDIKYTTHYLQHSQDENSSKQNFLHHLYYLESDFLLRNDLSNCAEAEARPDHRSCHPLLVFWVSPESRVSHASGWKPLSCNDSEAGCKSFGIWKNEDR